MPKFNFFIMEMQESHSDWFPMRLFKTTMGFRELRDHRTANPEFKQTSVSRTAPPGIETRVKRVSPRKFYNMRRRYIELDAIELTS